MPVTVTKDNFIDLVMNSDKPVLIDFWAAWCGPCRTISPVIDKLSLDFDGRAMVAKVNVDDETELAEQFRVVSIPSIIVINNGEVVERVVGARGEQELSELLNKYI